MYDFFLEIKSINSNRFRLINLKHIEYIDVDPDRQRLRIITTVNREYICENEQADSVLRQIKQIYKIQGLYTDFGFRLESMFDFDEDN